MGRGRKWRTGSAGRVLGPLEVTRRFPSNKQPKEGGWSDLKSTEMSVKG